MAPAKARGAVEEPVRKYQIAKPRTSGSQLVDLGLLREYTARGLREEECGRILDTRDRECERRFSNPVASSPQHRFGQDFTLYEQFADIVFPGVPQPNTCSNSHGLLVNKIRLRTPVEHEPAAR
jgi:hypothetical protein